MRYLFLKPKLKDLTQGSRIAFARQFRKFTQDEVSEKLGLTGENKRVNMTRYEKGEITPKDDKLIEIANILKINHHSIEKYNFENPLDIVYIFTWLEKLYPKMNIDVARRYIQRNKKSSDKLIIRWIDLFNKIEDIKK